MSMASLFAELKELYDVARKNPDGAKNLSEERMGSMRSNALNEATNYLLGSDDACTNFESSMRRAAREGYKRCTILTWDRNNSPKFGSSYGSSGIYLLDLLNNHGLINYLQDFLDEKYAGTGDSRFLVFYHKLGSVNSTAFRLVVSWDKENEEQIRQTLENNATIALRKQEDREKNRQQRSDGGRPSERSDSGRLDGGRSDRDRPDRNRSDGGRSDRSRYDRSRPDHDRRDRSRNPDVEEQCHHCSP